MPHPMIHSPTPGKIQPFPHRHSPPSPPLAAGRLMRCNVCGGLRNCVYMRTFYITDETSLLRTVKLINRVWSWSAVFRKVIHFLQP